MGQNSSTDLEIGIELNVESNERECPDKLSQMMKDAIGYIHVRLPFRRAMATSRS